MLLLTCACLCMHGHMWLPPYWGQVHQSPVLQEKRREQHRPGGFITLVPSNSNLGCSMRLGSEATVT